MELDLFDAQAAHYNFAVSSLQRTPLASVSRLRAASQTCSDSTRTPSRSKMTACIRPLMSPDYLRWAMCSRNSFARGRRRVRNRMSTALRRKEG